MKFAFDSLFLCSLLLGLVQAAQIGVRMEVSDGTAVAGAHCSDTEIVDVVGAVDVRAVLSNDFFDTTTTNPTARDRHLTINCGKICCGFPYGLCYVYQPRCIGFPTYSSYQQWCHRMLNEGDNQHNHQLGADGAAADMHDGRYLRAASSETRQLQIFSTALQEIPQCKALIAEAKTALLAVENSVSTSCKAYLALPIEYVCYVIS
jgi:hypothetical protein